MNNLKVNRGTTLIITLAWVALLAVAGNAVADDDGFHFYLDPVLLQPFYTDVDNNSAKFEEYRDMDSAMTGALAANSGREWRYSAYARLSGPKHLT